ncbi:ketol-acid reductoisomerase [uncultured Sphingomonas sp.]|uniref:ketol-acid reductoisomerase n=1 Tax=uncultured Sphingomonas sp. TaxID=158754 RepID=UPI0025F80C09|nr:ketol-acid reductoisomerase [uncultured Sphingomonas sp.]
MIRDPDIDLTPLRGQTVAIVGFGNQGRAQALNLRDTGISVRIGLRESSARRIEAQSYDLAVMPPAEAAAGANLIMLLAPDEQLAAVYDQVEPALMPGAALGFSHGLAIHFGLIRPRPDLAVIMVAPKGPGSALRSLYEAGRGMVALAAVAHDSSGTAWPLTLAYASAIGCGRAGVIASSFEEECVADLFNEQAVVWGGVPALLQAGFETLVGAGYKPEVAYLECVSELKLIAELIEARGMAGMAEAISNTAELGALLGGPRIVDESVHARMRTILREVRDGVFAEALGEEAAADYPRLRQARLKARSGVLERTRERLLGPG